MFVQAESFLLRLPFFILRVVSLTLLISALLINLSQPSAAFDPLYTFPLAGHCDEPINQCFPTPLEPDRCRLPLSASFTVQPPSSWPGLVISIEELRDNLVKLDPLFIARSLLAKKQRERRDDAIISGSSIAAHPVDQISHSDAFRVVQPCELVLLIYADTLPECGMDELMVRHGVKAVYPNAVARVDVDRVDWWLRDEEVVPGEFGSIDPSLEWSLIRVRSMQDLPVICLERHIAVDLCALAHRRILQQLEDIEQGCATGREWLVKKEEVFAPTRLRTDRTRMLTAIQQGVMDEACNH